VVEECPSGSAADIPPEFLAACGDLPGPDCLQVFHDEPIYADVYDDAAGNPTAIAAYSIVGEKTTTASNHCWQHR